MRLYNVCALSLVASVASAGCFTLKTPTDAGDSAVDQQSPRPDAVDDFVAPVDTFVPPRDVVSDRETVDTGVLVDTGVVVDTGLPVDTGIGDAATADVACAAGSTLCGSTCIDTRTNMANCGACGAVCSAPGGGTATCAAGRCDRVCPAGTTLCGDRCANLLTDVDHCGACGYRVVSAGRMGEAAQRTCVDGRPTPAWVPVSMTGGPSVAEAPQMRAWTGRRMLVSGMSPSSVLYLYDPPSNSWTNAGAMRLPIGPTPSDFRNYVSMPNRQSVMVWAGDSMRRSYGLVVRDTGSSITVANTSSWPAPLTPRTEVALSYDGDNVYVMYGYDSTLDDGGVYNVAGDRWSLIPSTTTGVCAMMDRHGRAPTAFAGGRVNSFGGYAGSTTSFCAENSAFSYDTVSSAWLAPVLNVAVPNRLAHAWLGVGSRVFMWGGQAQNSSVLADSWLLNPAVRTSAAWTAVSSPASPATATLFPFSMFTGKSIILFSGVTAIWSGAQPGGSLGVVSGASVNWQTLPSAGAPTPRSAYVAHEMGNSQTLWTGSEAFIWGGYDGTTARNDGARYQPPVGCVCPTNADAPSWLPTPCTGVSTTGLPACVP